jgi:hypothetical protein
MSLRLGAQGKKTNSILCKTLDSQDFSSRVRALPKQGRAV